MDKTVTRTMIFQKIFVLPAVFALALALAIINLPRANASHTTFPNLVVKEIKFVKEYSGMKNVFLAHVCNNGIVEANSDFMITRFYANSQTSTHSWGGFKLAPGECTQDNSGAVPFSPVSTYNITKSGNFNVTALVDETDKVAEYNEDDNSKQQSVFVDLGELQVITDLKIVGKELQWTTPKTTPKKYLITYYTGETSDPNATFGGCASTPSEYGTSGGYCVGQAADINYTSGHLEKLTLTVPPIKTLIVRYEDANGQISGNSNLAVYKLANLMIGDLQYYKQLNGKNNVILAKVCNTGSATAGDGTKYIQVTINANGMAMRANAPNFRLDPGKCTDEKTSPQDTVEILNIYQTGTYLVKAYVNPDKVYPEYNYEDNSLEESMYMEVNTLRVITDLRVYGSQLQWTVPQQTNIKQYYISYYTGETYDSGAAFTGCGYDQYQAQNPGGSTYCVGWAVDVNFQPGHLEKLRGEFYN